MHCAAITRISKNAAPARLVVWAIALRILRPSSMRMRAIADQVSSSSIDVDPPASDFPRQVILLRAVCSLRLEWKGTGLPPLILFFQSEAFAAIRIEYMDATARKAECDALAGGG